MEKRFFTERELSQFTGLTLSKLRADRMRNRGLPYSKVGRSVLYDIQDVLAYLRARKSAPRLLRQGKTG